MPETFSDMTNLRMRPTHGRKDNDTIKCECGAEILFLPDVRSMGEAIEIHVALHMEKVKLPATADTEAEAERLRNALIVQVFKLALSKGSQLDDNGAFEIDSN